MIQEFSMVFGKVMMKPKQENSVTGKTKRQPKDISKLSICRDSLNYIDMAMEEDKNNFETIISVVDGNFPCTSSDSLHTEHERRNFVDYRGTANNNSIQTSNVLRPVALDCEMVGVGDDKSSALARCSIVDYEEDVVYDAYVKPSKPVTDYRTQWSGIRPKHLKNAISFRSARNKVKGIIKNRVLVGHALHFDLKVLRLQHFPDLIRDTSEHIPLRALAGFPRNSTPSLKCLARQLLKWDIQVDEHSSVEDARAAMLLYKKCEAKWEKGNRKGNKDQSYLEDVYWPNWTKAVKQDKK